MGNERGVRGILNKLVTNAYHNSEQSGQLVRHIDQALALLRTEFEGALPKEEIYSESGERYESGHVQGHNDCLKEVRASLDRVWEVKE